MRQPLTVNEGTGAARKLTAKDANEKLAHRRLTVLELAARLGNVAEACRRGGIDGTSFYDWKRRFQLEGLDGLKDLLPIAKSHPMTTPPEVVARIEPGDSARFRGPGLMRSFITWPRPPLSPLRPLSAHQPAVRRRDSQGRMDQPNHWLTTIG